MVPPTPPPPCFKSPLPPMIHGWARRDASCSDWRLESDVTAQTDGRSAAPASDSPHYPSDLSCILGLEPEEGELLPMWLQIACVSVLTEKSIKWLLKCLKCPLTLVCQDNGERDTTKAGCEEERMALFFQHQSVFVLLSLTRKCHQTMVLVIVPETDSKRWSWDWEKASKPFCSSLDKCAEYEWEIQLLKDNKQSKTGHLSSHWAYWLFRLASFRSFWKKTTVKRTMSRENEWRKILVLELYTYLWSFSSDSAGLKQIKWFWIRFLKKCFQLGYPSLTLVLS